VEKEPHVIGGVLRCRLRDDHSAVLAPSYDEQSLGLEDSEGLSKARTARGKLGEQHGLRRKLCAILEMPLDDPAPECRSNGVRDARSPKVVAAWRLGRLTVHHPRVSPPST
jgi:hypothetical protein